MSKEEITNDHHRVETEEGCHDTEEVSGCDTGRCDEWSEGWTGEARADYGKGLLKELAARLTTDFGKGLLKELAARLTTDFGKGFDESNLRYMRLFYRCFPKCHRYR